MNNFTIKKHIYVILIYFILILFFTFPAWLKIGTLVYGFIQDTDNRGALWSFWWERYAYLNNLDANKVSILAAPFGQESIREIQPYILKFIFKWSSILTNDIVTYNFWLITSFVLAALFMYLLVFYFTRSYYAAFIAGLIYGFCPYHFNKAWEHYLLAQIQWMPLYILSVFMLYEKISLKNIIIFIIACTLLLSFEFTYVYIMLIFTLGFFIFIFYQHFIKIKLFKNKDLLKFDNLFYDLRFLKNFLLISLLAILVNMPIIFPILKAFFIAPETSAATIDAGSRPFRYLFSQSAHISNYFFPAVSNPLLGRITKPFIGSIFYGRGSIEQTLYLGWTSIILALIAQKFTKTKYSKEISVKNAFLKENIFLTKLFLFIALLGVLFSMPPYWNFGIFKIYFPSFFMYKIFPMFRAYARFGILVMLAMGVLAGLGINYILSKKSRKSIFAIVFSCLILFEFNNIPPLRYTDMSLYPKVYQWLAEQKDNFIIVEYPFGEWSPGEAIERLDYLLYQRYHEKRLFNGAQPGTRAYEIKQKVINIASPYTAGILKELGVTYAVVHLDKYRGGANKNAFDIVGQIPDTSKLQGFRELTRFDEDVILEIIAKPINPDLVKVDIRSQND